jgi:hypothetical protein
MVALGLPLREGQEFLSGEFNGMVYVRYKKKSIKKIGAEQAMRKMMIAYIYMIYM